MGHLLLTGATGMLGGYLLRDALVARRPLAVLVRSKSHVSAALRIEAILAHWESQLHRRLPRPVVIDGDICEPALGLSARDRNWIGEHCDSVLHGAASIRFQPDDRTGEPFRSNVEGTRNLLAVCREGRIRRYAHVSTAYVCSSLGGLAREDAQRDPEAPGRNAYERSKIQAEALVLAAEHLQRVTILRPSIIIGDSQTGFASAFHTIYTPLRLGFLHLLSKLSAGWKFDARLAAEVAESSFLCGLGLTGDERKNLVPVDWVAAAALELVERQTVPVATFHLTNPASTPLALIAQTMLESVIDFVNDHGARRTGLPTALFESEQYREQMQIYAGHIGDDGEFDSSAAEAAAPQLPCPVIDLDALRRMWTFALSADFNWRPPRSSAGWSKLGELLERLPSLTRAEEVLQVEVPGPGGGVWLVGFEAGRPVAAERGWFPETRQTVYAAASALENLGNSESSVSKLVSEGKMGIAGDDPQRIATVLVPALAEWLISTIAARCSPQPMAAPVAPTQRTHPA